MDINVNLGDYLNDEEIKEIAKQELRSAFRAQCKSETDVERILVNLSYEYVRELVNSQWDGDFSELLRKRIKEAIEGDSVPFHIFRRADAWDRSESPAVKILDEECRNSRPLIRAEVEKRIAEYPFHELERDHIAEVIYDVIVDRILSTRNEADDER